MESLIVHPYNEEQQKALQVLFDSFKIPYEAEPSSDATTYLISTEANKKWLDTALAEHKNGEGAEIKLEDLWK